MVYAVVIRNGVWVRTLAEKVRPTDILARGTTCQGLLRRSASSSQVGTGEIGKCVGFHQHRCVGNRVGEARVLHHQCHTADETQQTEYASYWVAGKRID